MNKIKLYLSIFIDGIGNLKYIKIKVGGQLIGSIFKFIE